MKKTLLATTAGLLSLSSVAQADNGEVNIYSYRQPFLIQPFLDKFTEETGIKTNVVFAKKGIFERVKSEGKDSPADLIFTVDVANLTAGADKHGIAQPIESQTVEANIPAQYIADDKEWVGLTKRVRVFAVSKEMPLSQAPKNYEDLAKPEYKGKICIRSGKNKYNVSLFASMIAEHGEAKTKEWLESLKANLARKPEGNDRAQVKAVTEGICEIAVLNNYYLGKMLFKFDKKLGKNVPNLKQRDWVQKVNIIFPNQDNRGAHANISGVLLAKYSPNKENALKLVDFLTGDEAQAMYAELNYEYPLKADVQPSALLASWGAPKVDSVSMDKVAKLRDTALKLVDEVKFDSK
ncbi:MAG: iron ABC transporter substrate-binding protein [Gammaproteobacteria bacterium]|nr:MAG: iron ABC transporter substrate-binding protein [Gammaproteobacteria bacterium]